MLLVDTGIINERVKMFLSHYKFVGHKRMYYPTSVFRGLKVSGCRNRSYSSGEAGKYGVCGGV